MVKRSSPGFTFLLNTHFAFFKKINSHPSSPNSFRSAQYSGTLDATLNQVWEDFEQNDWEIKHSVCATKFSDSHFTKEFQDIQKKGNIY